MATSISSIGVGSGLPLDTLLQQFRTAENAPLAALQSRADKESARFSGYGTLKSALDAVSTAAANLGKGETFNAVKTTVTGDSFTATAKPGSGAIPGNHSISVKRLATSQVLASGRASSSDTAVQAKATGTVSLKFTVGTGTEATGRSLSVNANASLQDIAKAINGDSELNFSATLMNDGKGHRLIISSNETGEQNVITKIEVSGESAGNTALSNILGYNRTGPTVGELDPTSMGESVAGLNAEVLINDISVVSQDNELEDAIEGVTIKLTKQAAEGAQPDSLQVTRDDTTTTTAAKNFVNAYNALQSTITALTSYDVDAQQGAALSGDSLARRAQSQVRAAFNGLAENGVTLSSIGITTDSKTGNLVLDEEKFNAALTDNRADIEKLFAGENGLSKRVTEATEVFTKSTGLIKTSQDGIERTLRMLEDQYDTMSARIDQKMETYRMQFVQLDTFMAQMNGVSSYLTSQLSMLENLGSGDQK